MALRFTWDPKNASNLADHGVNFIMARATFKDTLAVVEIDDREDYGEERLIRTAMVGERYLAVVYTQRDDEESDDEIIRIISARKATAHERRKYQEG